MVHFLRTVRQRPTWQPLTPEARSCFDSPIPSQGTPLERVYTDFRENILPFTLGNTNPSYVGWVDGGGSPTGMLAELLSAGINSNVAGGNHSRLCRAPGH